MLLLLSFCPLMFYDQIISKTSPQKAFFMEKHRAAFHANLFQGNFIKAMNEYIHRFFYVIRECRHTCNNALFTHIISYF